MAINITHTKRKRQTDIIYYVFVKRKKKNLNQIKLLRQTSRSNFQFSGNAEGKSEV